MFIDLYKNNIIENIFTYSSDHEYENAILFKDARHKKSIMEKLKQYDKNEKAQLNWSFHNGEEHESKQQKQYLINTYSNNCVTNSSYIP